MTIQNNGYPVNFKPDEFYCTCEHDDCDGHPPDPAATRHLAWALQAIRSAVEVPLTINSGYRCPKHNADVGGVKNSYHLKGIAADLKPHGVTPKELHEAIEGLVSAGQIPAGGMGLYNSFVHYDIRYQRGRWNG